MRLTLVSAPAGFGKTTLLAEWLAGAPTERSVAWLSLEESDRQPASYWTYLITALQTVVPGVGTSALPLLQSGQPPIETVLTTVLNELGTVPDDLYLVLDDYHLVDGPEVQAGMAFLLEHLPPQVHLVLSTRADPDLPLARLSWTSIPTTFLTCTGGPAGGTSRPGNPLRRFATPWPPRTSSEPRIWSSWRSRTCAGAGRRPPSGAGWRPFPTTWSGPGRCSRWASWER